MKIVVGVVEHKDEILLIDRNKPPFKDKLILPGGKIEEGEEPAEAMERELTEETGLETKEIKEAGYYHETLKDDKEYTHRLRAFHIKPEGFAFRSSEEGEVISAKKEKIPSLKGRIVPSDYRIIERALLNEESYFRAKVTVRKKNSEYILEKEEDY